MIHFDLTRLILHDQQTSWHKAHRMVFLQELQSFQHCVYWWIKSSFISQKDFRFILYMNAESSAWKQVNNNPQLQSKFHIKGKQMDSRHFHVRRKVSNKTRKLSHNLIKTLLKKTRTISGCLYWTMQHIRAQQQTNLKTFNLFKF